MASTEEILCSVDMRKAERARELERVSGKSINELIDLFSVYADLGYGDLDYYSIVSRLMDQRTVITDTIHYINRLKHDLDIQYDENDRLESENSRLEKLSMEMDDGRCGNDDTQVTFTYSGDIDPSYFINMELDVVGRGD